ncbi:MAG: TonB C-terminal domain-containing protein, partial [Myxococcota bacterium]
VLGEEELREERDRFVAEQTSRTRGGRHQERWAEFQASLENYATNVRPGNQTALNAAADPFAEFEAKVHRRIHPNFAEGFLANLPGGASSPFNDMTLLTKLEIVFNRDGSLAEVNFVRRSGFTPFDYGAWNAVQRGQPYPAPPEQILSGDGRVYFHWGFYRNGRQCGTFNAQPFLLPNPGGQRPGTLDPGVPGSPAPDSGGEGGDEGPPAPRDDADRPRRPRLRYPGGSAAT